MSDESFGVSAKGGRAVDGGVQARAGGGGP